MTSIKDFRNLNIYILEILAKKTASIEFKS